MTHLFVGGHFRQHCQPLTPRHRNGTQLARLHMRQRRGHLVKVHRHLPAQYIVDCRACTTIGNVHHLDTRRLDELRPPHMANGAVAGRGVADLAGIGLQVGHQLCKIFDRNHAVVDHDNARGLHHLAHAHKVFDGVIRQFFVHRWVDAMGGQCGNTKGIAIHSARHFGHANGATSTGLVFNDHGLAQQLAQSILHIARHHVGSPPWREWHNDAQWCRVLCGGQHGETGRQSDYGHRDKEGATLHKTNLSSNATSAHALLTLLARKQHAKPRRQDGQQKTRRP